MYYAYGHVPTARCKECYNIMCLIHIGKNKRDGDMLYRNLTFHCTACGKEEIHQEVLAEHYIRGVIPEN
jgi:hypothetical protein